MSNDEFRLITTLVRYHDTPLATTEKSVRRALNKYGETGLKLLLRLKRADNRGQNIRDFDRTAEYDRLEEMIDYVLEKQQCFSLKQLAVNGSDLMASGIPPSPQLGRMLDTLLDMVINGEIENNREKLLAAAEILRNKETGI